MQYAEKKQTKQQSLYYTKYSILKLFGLTVDFFVLLNEGVQVFFHDIYILLFAVPIFTLLLVYIILIFTFFLNLK